MRHLAEFVSQEGFNGPLAYYNRNWRRSDSPLLDHLGAVIDHMESHSGGGRSTISNLVTACNKCNATKSNSPADFFAKRSPPRLVKGKYGEPKYWDGFSTLFMVLVARNPSGTTPTERAWLRVLNLVIPIQTDSQRIALV
jgi:hypothetical protein